MKRKWYSEIVLLHCIGLLLVLLAHIAQANGLFIGGIGAPIFLFVAGFLVSINRKPHNVEWLKKKAIRILVPYYILLVVVLIVFLIIKTEPFNWNQWLVLFANMQGLTNFLFYNDLSGYYAPLWQGLGHLWFVTLIMVCFVLVPVFEKICEFNFWKKHQIWVIVLTIIVLQPVLLLYNVQISVLVTFFLGYLFAKNEVTMTGKRFVWVTIAMVSLCVVRLISRQFIDDTLIYNNYIAGISNCGISLWIVSLLFFIRRVKPDTIDTIAKWRFIVWLESIIYEFYLIHHIIIKGSWSFYALGLNPWLATAIVLTVTVALSLLLKKASNAVTSRIIPKK